MCGPRVPRREAVHMRAIEGAVGQDVVWRPRTMLSRTYDLVVPGEGHDEPYATLVWRPGFLRLGPAEARTSEGEWLFRRRGFFREQVLVFAPGAGQPLATLQRHWRRGVLRLDGGKELVWRREGFWSTTHRFEDGNGTALVRFRHRFAFLRASSRVEIESSVPARDGALLACLGWYLLLLARRHSGARGAA